MIPYLTGMFLKPYKEKLTGTELTVPSWLYYVTIKWTQPVFDLFCVVLSNNYVLMEKKKKLTLTGTDYAEKEEGSLWETDKVEEAPRCAKQTSETPDTEKSHAFLPPLRPVPYLCSHKEKHDCTRARHNSQ